MEPERIENKEFLVGLRGYDRDEVARFLKEVAEEMRRLRALAELPREAGAGSSEETTDAASLYKKVGEETSRILLAAEESGREIVEKAKAEAAGLLSDARTRSEAIEERSRARQEESEDYLRRLEDARGVLATQLVDVGRRLEETVSRLGMPVETPRPPMERVEAAEVVPQEPAVVPQEPAVLEPPGVEVPPETGGAEVHKEPLEESAGALEGMLEEIRREREEGRRQVEEALALTEAEPAPPEPAPSGPASPEPGGHPEAAGALARRDEALGELALNASSRLKRLLGEDQNDLLDRIRISRGRGDFDTEVFPYEEQRRRFIDGIGELMRAAFDAGRTAAGATGPGDPGGRIEELATKQLVDPLRAEIARVIQPGLDAGDTATSIAERAGDVFRVWKGVRTEMLGEGLVYAMYHQGLIDQWKAAGVASKVWAFGPDETNCPGVCRDNAGADAVGIDDPFPSGHTAPPAHGGCSCSLIAVDG